MAPTRPGICSWGSWQQNAPPWSALEPGRGCRPVAPGDAARSRVDVGCESPPATSHRRQGALGQGCPSRVYSAGTTGTACSAVQRSRA